MAPISRWRKAIRIAAVSILVLIAAIAVSVPIQQHLLRWRAERLLADIRALQMGKSTWADAQNLMTRWGEWGSYEGTCTQARCSYQINLPDAFLRIQNHWSSGCCVWMLHPYRFLGGRDAFALARLEVINGLVWGKNYGVTIGVPTSDDKGEFDYDLLASANTVWRTENFRKIQKSPHPEYEIGHPDGCEGCRQVYVRFTPFADPQTVNSLMDFNFDCLTRKTPCLNQMDIMPSVWKRVLAEEQATEDFERRDGEVTQVCSSSVEFLGRDRENIVIARIVSIDRVHWEPQTQLSLRLVERLKRADFWNSTDEWNTLDFGDQKGERRPKDEQPSPGSEVILAFSSPYGLSSPHGINIDECGLIPLTKENLLSIQRGIKQDVFQLINERILSN